MCQKGESKCFKYNLGVILINVWINWTKELIEIIENPTSLTKTWKLGIFKGLMF